MTTTIETKRLILRPLRADDRDMLVAGLDNLNVSRNTARIPFPYGGADADAFLEQVKADGIGTLRMAITRKTGDGRLCGVISYETGEAVELGYWLAEPVWGQGFGREAARAMTDHAFLVAGHDALAAGYRMGNEASRRILERLGFQETGTAAVVTKAAGMVTVMRLALSRARWQETKGR